MNIDISSSYEEMSRRTADYICGLIREKPEAIISFPSGDTPMGVFKYLAEYSNSGKTDFSKCTFIGLDEWVGMDRFHEGSCKYYMYKCLFEPLKIDEGNIVYFDACSNDLDGECRRIDEFISSRGPIDIMMVGIGMNGHIGLNEPGCSFDSYSHTVELAGTTKDVAQKYFKSSTALSRGITLGMGHLMEAETAILIANGSKKAEIIQKAVEGPVTNDVPASILQKHKNCILFIDNDAASRLRKDRLGDAL